MNIQRVTMIAIVCITLLAGFACVKQKMPKMTTESVQPGTQVTFKGKALKLLGTPIHIGQTLPSVNLVDAATMSDVDLSKEKGSVLLLSMVASIDTPVCEAQTHYLSEQGNSLPSDVKRIVISRDTPFAQKRFAKEAKLENLQYLSDYKEAAFAKATGLLVDDLMLLARGVIIVDRKGIVQYVQIVPEITLLPDMDTAFKKAKEIAAMK